MNGTYLKNTKILSISLVAAQKAEAGMLPGARIC